MVNRNRAAVKAFAQNLQRWCICIGLSAGGFSSVALAADETKTTLPNDNSSLLTEITVTAQRREQNLQDVGLSVTAFTGDQLTKMGFTNAMDLVKLTPAVSIYQIHASVTNINIRGVSQNYFADHLEAPIAVYQDDAYLGSTSSVGVRSFDLDRVEVLRGPQGTLFGRNATGGLIQYVSKAPTDHLDAYAQVTGGGYQYGGAFIQTEGGIGGPISDRIRARLAIASNDDDGPWRNGVGANPGNTREYAARLRVDVDITDKTKLGIIAYTDVNPESYGAAYTTQAAGVGPHGLGYPLSPTQIGSYVNLAALPALQNIDAPCPGCDLTGYRQGNNPYKVSLSNPGLFRRDINSLTAKLTQDYGHVQLTSITNFQDVTKKLGLDSDGSPSFLFDYGTQMHYRQYSQELRINGDSERFKWVAGVFYLDESGKYAVDGNFDLGPYIGLTCTAPACTSGSGVADQFRADYALRTRSGSGFAQSDFYILPTVYVTGGLRYTYDAKSFEYHWHDTLGFQSVLTGGPPTIDYTPATDPTAARSFSNVSAKGQLNWAPNSDVLTYVGWTRGYKGGTWSGPIFPPIIVSTLPDREERLTSIEGGGKLRLFDGRATLNGSAFHYNYKDYQAFAIVNLVQKIFNVDATANGGEVEFRFAPNSKWELGLSGAFIHSDVRNVPLPDGTLAGRVLPNAPSVSLYGLARYNFEVFGGQLGAQVNTNYIGRHYLTTLNEPTNFEGSHVTTDLRLDFAPPNSHFTYAAFVRNVTNVWARIYGLDVSSLGYSASVYAPPRTYGMTVAWRY